MEDDLLEMEGWMRQKWNHDGQKKAVLWLSPVLHIDVLGPPHSIYGYVVFAYLHYRGKKHTVFEFNGPKTMEDAKKQACQMMLDFILSVVNA
jgi:hypothetical protein